MHFLKVMCCIYLGKIHSLLQISPEKESTYFNGINFKFKLNYNYKNIISLR